MGLKEHIIELKGGVSSEPCFLQTGHWSIPFAESGLTSTVVTLYGLMHCILNLVERGNLRESLPALAVVCKKTMAFSWFSTENSLNSAFAPKAHAWNSAGRDKQVPKRVGVQLLGLHLPQKRHLFPNGISTFVGNLYCREFIFCWDPLKQIHSWQFQGLVPPSDVSTGMDRSELLPVLIGCWTSICFPCWCFTWKGCGDILMFVVARAWYPRVVKHG